MLTTRAAFRLSLLTCLVASFARPAIAEVATDQSVSLPDVTQLHPSSQREQNKRWIRVSANLVLDTAESVLEKIDAARARGANGVVFADTKLNTWWFRPAGNTWFERMDAVRRGVRDRNMEFVMASTTLGFCNSLLAFDTHLASAYPVVDQPLRVTAGVLQAINTGTLTNGGFEAFAGDEPNGWSFQDAAGERTFIDTNVARSGNASFRADARDDQMSRVSTVMQTQPWHQYTLRVWVRSESLSARNVAVIVKDNARDNNLTQQDMSLPRDGGGRAYFSGANDLTINDWTPIDLSFNSQDSTDVRILLAVFGGTNGSIWWDDAELLDTPTMNWLQRDQLDVSARRAPDELDLVEGSDFSTVVDSLLGESTFTGTYDNYHTPDPISLPSGSRLVDGDTVLLSGYHTMVTTNGQIGCSWNEDEVIDLIERIHIENEARYDPDAYLVNVSEVRTGGFEPTDAPFADSGAALANSLSRTMAVVANATDDAPIYFWSDMVDPVHNARPDYYQVANTLFGAWEGLDPERVVILNWWSRANLQDIEQTRASLRHFSDLGFRQIIGGFYDEDVAANHSAWIEASAGLPGIIGSMYTTWTADYEHIDAFADLWWP